MARSEAPLRSEPLQTAFGEVARVGALVAAYCDHIEHNEPVSAETLLAAGARLRDVATFIAAMLEIDLLVAYADRLQELERRSPVEPLLPSPADEVRRARTWRDLQIAQLRHDRHYHPDVFGLHRREQLIHVALHLSKLTGSVAIFVEGTPGSRIEFQQRRLPDLMLFGVKLSTLVGQTLSDSAHALTPPEPEI